MSKRQKSRYPWTIESMAKEMGLTLGSFKQWKLKAEMTGEIKKPKVGSAYCVRDPGANRYLYSNSYLKQIQKARAGIKPRSKPKRKAVAELRLGKTGKTVTYQVQIPAEYAEFVSPRMLTQLLAAPLMNLLKQLGVKR